MKKSDLIKKSIQDNMIDENAVLQNVLSSQPKRLSFSHGFKAVLAACACLILICSAALPTLLNMTTDETNFCDDNFYGNNTSIINGNNNQAVANGEEVSSCEENVISVDCRVLNYLYALSIISLGTDTEVNSNYDAISGFDGVVIEEQVSDGYAISVYLNKHDTKPYNTYYYNKYTALTTEQAYQEMLDGNYTARLLTGQTTEESTVSNIVYVTGEECDYYLPFYVVFEGEYAYMVPAISKSCFINTGK